MIVRNESAVIDRCLASARPLIDTWVICDTGSTDDTISRIQSALDGIPGRLLHQPWVNFGTNRTNLLREARSAATYLLLLDADMTLVGDRADLLHLTGDGYYLPVHDGTVTYWMPYLIRADRPWRYTGVTHEYLTCEDPVTWARLPAWRVYHHADGGMRADKWTRDYALLTEAVAADPTDARSVFYLAQTCRDRGDVAAAITWYRQRVSLGGWEEEIFYAQYQIGVLLAATEWTAAVPELLAAWNLRPHRAEPWYHLACGWRAHQQWHLAYLATQQGLALPEPDDLLFVESWIYGWGLWFEHSLAAYYTGHVREARAANDRVLADPTVPELWRSHAQKNAQWWS